MKKCSKCRIEKPLSEFNNSKGRKDGLCPQCKNCKKEYRDSRKEERKEWNKVHYQKNKNIIDKKNKDYYNKNKEDIVRYKAKYYEERVDEIKVNMKEYRKTKKCKELKAKSNKLYIERNPVKHKARYTLRNNILSGRVMKSNICELCGESELIIHGHHHDYKKPLDVVWCCSQCHSDIHNNKINKKETK